MRQNPVFLRFIVIMFTKLRLNFETQCFLAVNHYGLSTYMCHTRSSFSFVISAVNCQCLVFVLSVISQNCLMRSVRYSTAYGANRTFTASVW